MEKHKVDAPEHLSPRSAAIWRDLVPRRARSPERQVLLQAALEALDMADASRATVEREGATFKTKKSGAVHAHPALALERQARAQFVRIWTTLALQFDHLLDGAL